MSNARLDEFDQLEWWDVARRVDPAMTWERFERDWAEFVRMKEAATVSEVPKFWRGMAALLDFGPYRPL